MKILCLLVMLANLSLLIWEYRTGAFEPSKVENAAASDVNGKEPIVLLSELKKATSTTQQTGISTPVYKPENQEPKDRLTEDDMTTLPHSNLP